MTNLLPDFAKRLKRLRSFFPSWKVDALIISSPVDIYYLTGCTISMGTYLVTRNKALLFVDRRYFEQLKSQTGVHLNTTLAVEFQKLHIKKLGFDAQYVSYLEFQKLKKMHIALVPLDRPVLHVRAIKDAYEIHKIAKACKLCVQGVHWIIKHLRVGIQEKELASGVEIFFKQHGADKLSFSPIIAFGPNSAYPHYRAGSTRLKNNQHVQIDIGVCVDGYHSDISRVHFFGTVSKKIQEIEAIVSYAQKKAIEQCKAGFTTVQLDQIARDVIQKAGYGDFYVHGLGHGVGLDIHELPSIKKLPTAKEKTTLLQENMVITIEPGIYLPGIGGVRLEDTVVVQKNRCKILTKGI